MTKNRYYTVSFSFDRNQYKNEDLTDKQWREVRKKLDEKSFQRMSDDFIDTILETIAKVTDNESNTKDKSSE